MAVISEVTKIGTTLHHKVPDDPKNPCILGTLSTTLGLRPKSVTKGLLAGVPQPPPILRSQQFLHFPNIIRDPSSHGGRDAQRFVNAAVNGPRFVNGTESSVVGYFEFNSHVLLGEVPAQLVLFRKRREWLLSADEPD